MAKNGIRFNSSQLNIYSYQVSSEKKKIGAKT